jgi:hypothetical protein
MLHKRFATKTTRKIPAVKMLIATRKENDVYSMQMTESIQIAYDGCFGFDTGQHPQFSTPLYFPIGKKRGIPEYKCVEDTRSWFEDCRLVQMQFKQTNSKWE